MKKNKSHSDRSWLQRFWNGLSVSLSSRGSSDRPDEPSKIETALPSQIGAYRILERLGRGGFGEVFLAQEIKTEKLFALKILFETKEKHRSQFFREAALTSQLEYPHIVRSFEFGEYEGGPYFTMEHLRGGSLGTLIPRVAKLATILQFMKAESPLDVWIETEIGSGEKQKYGALVLRVASQTAGALSFIHGQGLLHLDLKPSNILLDSKGNGKLSDFGLSLTPRSQASSLRSGTAPYLSPEQVRGETLGPASDIFSFGATFYEALSLKRAFSGSYFEEICCAVLSCDPTPLREINPGIPEGLATIVHRCLEKSPENRYASAAELAEDLKRLEQGLAVHRPSLPATRPRRRSFLPVSAVLAVSSVLLYAGSTLAFESGSQSDSVAAIPIDNFIALAKTPDPPSKPQEEPVPAPTLSLLTYEVRGYRYSGIAGLFVAKSWEGRPLPQPLPSKSHPEPLNLPASTNEKSALLSGVWVQPDDYADWVYGLQNRSAFQIHLYLPEGALLEPLVWVNREEGATPEKDYSKLAGNISYFHWGELTETKRGFALIPEWPGLGYSRANRWSTDLPCLRVRTDEGLYFTFAKFRVEAELFGNSLEKSTRILLSKEILNPLRGSYLKVPFEPVFSIESSASPEKTQSLQEAWVACPDYCVRLDKKLSVGK